MVGSAVPRPPISDTAETLPEESDADEGLPSSHFASSFQNRRQIRDWRRRRDSNPRYALRAYNGLANRRLQPLGHVSSTHGYAQDQRFRQPERRRLAAYTLIILRARSLMSQCFVSQSRAARWAAAISAGDIFAAISCRNCTASLLP